MSEDALKIIAFIERKVEAARLARDETNTEEGIREWALLQNHYAELDFLLREIKIEFGVK